jgi:hypothetical protein
MRPLLFGKAAKPGRQFITVAVADWKAADLNMDY